MDGLDSATSSSLSQNEPISFRTRHEQMVSHRHSTHKATIKIIQHLLDNELTIDDIHLTIFSESSARLPPLLTPIKPEEMNVLLGGILEHVLQLIPRLHSSSLYNYRNSR